MPIRKTERRKGIMKVISLGAGVQSSCLLLMASKGIIEADQAVFADTGNERSSTYEYIEYLKSVSSIPLVIVKNHKKGGGGIVDDLIKCVFDENTWFDGMPPLWMNDSKGNGQARQQCTGYYKIKPIERYIKASKHAENTMLIGISTDEIHRANSGKDGKIKREFPLIKLRMNRRDCLNWIKDNGFKMPAKSGCIICPYATEQNYKTYSKEEKELLVDIDEIVRSGFAREKKTKNLHRTYFLSHRRKPIKDILRQEDSQNDLFGEMLGCDSGMCFI